MNTKYKIKSINRTIPASFPAHGPLVVANFELLDKSTQYSAPRELERITQATFIIPPTACLKNHGSDERIESIPYLKNGTFYQFFSARIYSNTE